MAARRSVNVVVGLVAASGIVAGQVAVSSASSIHVDSLSDYQAQNWVCLPELEGFKFVALTGDNENGAIVVAAPQSDPTATRYVFRYEKVHPYWVFTGYAPFNVAGIAGDNRSGFIVFGGDNNQRVAKMQSYAKVDWLELASVEYPIRAITGDNRHGPIVVVEIEGQREIRYMDNYAENKWKTPTNPKPNFRIAGVTGNNATGVIVLGEGGELSRLEKWAGGNWTKIERADTQSTMAIAGDNQSGPAILQTSYVSVQSSYTGGSWTSIPHYPGCKSSGTRVAITGNNRTGVLIAKKQ